jgi:hypothetical protein
MGGGSPASTGSRTEPTRSRPISPTSARCSSARDEDLLAMKPAADRAQHRADIAELQQTRDDSGDGVRHQDGVDELVGTPVMRLA